MHNEISDATGDAGRRKAKRNERLSPDGKWRSFPKVPHLLQYISTGQFYGRIKVAGKPIRHKLGTDVFTNATLLLTDFIKKHRTEPTPTDDLPTTFRDARLQYEQSLNDSHNLAEGTKRYRRFCINSVLKSWQGLDDAKLNQITVRDCQAWAKKFSA